MDVETTRRLLFGIAILEKRSMSFIEEFKLFKSIRTMKDVDVVNNFNKKMHRYIIHESFLRLAAQRKLSNLLFSCSAYIIIIVSSIFLSLNNPKSYAIFIQFTICIILLIYKRKRKK